MHAVGLDRDGGGGDAPPPPAGAPPLSEGTRAQLVLLRGRAAWEAGLQYVGSNQVKLATGHLEAAAEALEHNTVFQVVGNDESGQSSSRSSIEAAGKGGAGGASSPPPTSYLAPSPTGAWAGFLPVPFPGAVRSSDGAVNAACTAARKLLVDVHCTLAVCHIRQKDAPAAAAAAQRSLAYNPHHVPALVALGDAYSGANRHAMAAKVYSSASRGRSGGGRLDRGGGRTRSLGA